MKNHLSKTVFYTLAIFISFTFACQSNHQENNSKSNGKADTIATKEQAPTDSTKKQVVEKQIDTIFGFDVSHFQGKVDWAAIKKSGRKFGIAKSTEGISYTDPEFQTNWKAMQENEMYRGTYHFYVAKEDPIKQAEHFVSTVKNMGEYHLPPALDLEGSDIGGLDVKEYQANVLLWLNYVEEQMGVKPMIYTNNPFGNEYLNHPKFGEYLLWVAEYREQAHVPKAWEEKGWTGWQFTEHDHTEGINGYVDESKFLSSILLN